MERNNKVNYEFLLKKDLGNNIISLKEELNLKKKKRNKIINKKNECIFLDNNIDYDTIFKLKTQLKKNKKNKLVNNKKEKND